VKTNNPLINFELLNLDDKIKQAFEEKGKNFGIRMGDFEVKYK
jgi:hypothetical protein